MIDLLKEYKRYQTERQLQLGDQWQNSGYVFVGKVGQPMHPDTLTGWFRKFTKKNGFDISVHSLRHTHASLMIANGVNIVTVSKRLGHSTPVTTSNIYAHAIKSADEKASDTFGDKINLKAQ